MAGGRSPQRPGPYPLRKKVDQWMAEHGKDFQDFAESAELPPSTAYGWVYRGRKIPAWAVKQIAEATRLTIEYWLNDALPYPPPKAWLRAEQRIREKLGQLSDEELEQLEEMLSSREDLRQTLDLRDVARRRSRAQGE